MVVTALYGGCKKEEWKIFCISLKVRKKPIFLKSDLPNKLIQCILVALCLLKVQSQPLVFFCGIGKKERQAKSKGRDVNRRIAEKGASVERRQS